MADQRRRPSQPYKVHHVRTERPPIPKMSATPAKEPVAYVGDGDRRHMDVEETIRMMAVSMEQIQAAVFSGQAPLDEASISSYEKKIDRARKWGGWIWGVISIVAFVFTLGVAYAVFMGANATDSEVEAADKAMIIDHNGGIDPNEIDAKTHKPVGHHPDMREDIKANTRAVIKIEEDILPPMLATQRKLDKRSEYQYELTKWESRVNEARRKKRQPPDKPPRLEELETELALGKY